MDFSFTSKSADWTTNGNSVGIGAPPVRTRQYSAERNCPEDKIHKVRYRNLHTIDLTKLIVRLSPS